MTDIIKTVIVTPTTHIASGNNAQTVFQIPPYVLSTNFRLGDVGSVSNLEETNYVNNAGVYSLFKAITLYNNNEVLDRLDRADLFMAFKAINCSNDESISIHKPLIKNKWGFQMNTLGQVDQLGLPVLPVTDDASTTSKSLVHLNKLLPLLGSSLLANGKRMPVMPANKWNLRLVIDWNTTKVYNDETNDGYVASILMPYLYVDQIMVDQTVNEVNSMNQFQYVFRGIDTDRVTVSATEEGYAQNTVAKINGFLGKDVSKLLLAVQPQQGQSDKLKGYCSMQQESETINFTINNKQFLNYSGIDGPQKKMGMLTDAWGTVNIPSIQSIGLNNAELFMTEYLVENTLGYLSYTGLKISDVVNQMEVQFNRVGGETDNLSGPLNLYFFGEVQKTILYSGGNTAVSY